MYPGESGSLVPFELRLLHVRLSGFTKRYRHAVSRICELWSLAQSKTRAALSAWETHTESVPSVDELHVLGLGMGERARDDVNRLAAPPALSGLSGYAREVFLSCLTDPSALVSAGATKGEQAEQEYWLWRGRMRACGWAMVVACVGAGDYMLAVECVETYCVEAAHPIEYLPLLARIRLSLGDRRGALSAFRLALSSSEALLPDEPDSGDAAHPAQPQTQQQQLSRRLAAAQRALWRGHAFAAQGAYSRAAVQYATAVVAVGRRIASETGAEAAWSAAAPDGVPPFEEESSESDAVGTEGPGESGVRMQLAEIAVSAASNLALSRAYTGHLSLGVRAYEALIATDPQHNATESLVKNLCTLYNLRGERTEERKRAIARLVVRHAPDGFDVSVLDLQA
jgi:tetratricopeptide (TPR) repeat protein